MALTVMPNETPTLQALQLPANMSFAEWVEMGEQLAAIEKSVMWWIGDWWAYGEHRYGERAAQALDSGRFAFQTFSNAAWVSRKFEENRRREVLSFGHHAEVAGLEPAAADALLDRAEAEDLSVKALRNEVRLLKLEAVVIPEPAAGRFSTIVADPPWQYDNVATRAAAENHYKTLDVDTLCRLPIVSQAADNSHCYLWTTNAFLPDAFRILQSWGFAYKTTLVWVKPQLGIGNYFRSSHEFVLFGIKGKLPVKDSNQRSWFEAKRGQHSRKPERFYELVETVSPGPYLELFARHDPQFSFFPRQGEWTAWGDEA